MFVVDGQLTELVVLVDNDVVHLFQAGITQNAEVELFNGWVQAVSV